MPPAAANRREEEILWEGAPSMRMVWVRLGLTVAVILVIEILLTIIFGFSGHWTRLLVYMGYLVALPVAAGSMWVRQKREKYRLTALYLYTTYGLIKKRDEQLDLRKYGDSSRSTDKWLQLLVGCGDIKVLSRDESDPVLVLRDLEDHQDAWETIREAGRKAMIEVITASAAEKQPKTSSAARRGAAAKDRE